MNKKVHILEAMYNRTRSENDNYVTTNRLGMDVYLPELKEMVGDGLILPHSDPSEGYVMTRKGASLLIADTRMYHASLPNNRENGFSEERRATLDGDIEELLNYQSELPMDGTEDESLLGKTYTFLVDDREYILTLFECDGIETASSCVTVGTAYMPYDDLDYMRMEQLLRRGLVIKSTERTNEGYILTGDALYIAMFLTTGADGEDLNELQYAPDPKPETEAPTLEGLLNASDLTDVLSGRADLYRQYAKAWRNRARLWEADHTLTYPSTKQGRYCKRMAEGYDDLLGVMSDPDRVKRLKEADESIRKLIDALGEDSRYIPAIIHASSPYLA